MVLWSVLFLVLTLHWLKSYIKDWSIKKKFWTGFNIILFSGASAVYLGDIYMNRAPSIVTVFL